jgi:hypothetical protein
MATVERERLAAEDARPNHPPSSAPVPLVRTSEIVQ